MKIPELLQTNPGHGPGHGAGRSRPAPKLGDLAGGVRTVAALTTLLLFSEGWRLEGDQSLRFDSGLSTVCCVV